MPRGRDSFWLHATVIEGKIICKYCEEQYTGGITRFKYHLAGLQCHDVAPCRNVPENVKELANKACRSLDDKPTKKGRLQGLNSSSSSFASNLNYSGSSASGQKQHTQTISGMFKKQEKDYVDKLLFKAIVMNNLPFYLLRSMDFKNFVTAATNFGPGYILPSSETARTRLLNEAKSDVLAYVDEMKKTWSKYGCTIMSDIWKDTIRSRSYINLLISSPSGTVFWKAKHAEKGPKNAEFIVDFLSSTIEEIGPKNVIQIVTDNGSNYRRAKYILEGRYPNIITTSCAAHCIDLMLKDIDNLRDVSSIMSKARQVVKFIYNKQQALDAMRTYTKGKELRRPGVTRFASHFICLDSVLKQEQCLRFMVASNEWRHVEEIESDGRELTTLLQNEDFWRKGREIISFVEPLVRVLKVVDGEGATMGYLYEALDRAKEAIRNASNDKREKYMPYWDIIDKRWNRNLHNPIHAAAAYLNPHLFWDHMVKMDDEVQDGIDLVTKKLLTNEDSVTMAQELLKYHNRDPTLFRDGMAMNLLHTAHPRAWWEMCGNSVPVLQNVAMKILSQPCSASACERNWSAFEAANTKKRNSLLPSRLTDLVFIRMNMHLQNMADELQKMNATAIYIDHVNPFPEEGESTMENNLPSNSEEESDEERMPRTNEDDSTSWDED